MRINKQLINETNPDLPQPGSIGWDGFCRGCSKSNAILSKEYFRSFTKMLMNSLFGFIEAFIGVGFFNRRVAQLSLAITRFLIAMIYFFLGVLVENQEWLLNEV